jgi:hypothetical protein
VRKKRYFYHIAASSKYPKIDPVVFLGKCQQRFPAMGNKL